MSKAKTKTKAKRVAGAKVFVVVRDAFDATDYEGVHFYRPSNDDGQRSGVPVRAFATRQTAAAFARQQDEDVRRTFPPPLFCGDDTDDESTFGPALVELVARLGLPAFEPGEYDYQTAKRFRVWWAEHAAGLSAEQRAAFWEPFAGMTFHRVKQVELED